MPRRQNESDQIETTDELLLHRSRQGDEAARAGAAYESSLRRQWLLDLKGTEDSLSITSTTDPETGEDITLKTADGTLIHRQAKMSSVKWVQSRPELKKFLARALARWRQDPSVLHEFYTNASIVDDLLAPAPRGTHKTLRSASLLAEMLPVKGRELRDFCDSVTFLPSTGLTEVRFLRGVLGQKLVQIIDALSEGVDTYRLLHVAQVDRVINRLAALDDSLSPSSTVTWPIVSRKIGLTELIAQLQGQSFLLKRAVPLTKLLDSPESYLTGEALSAFSDLLEGRLVEREAIEAAVLGLAQEAISEGDEGIATKGAGIRAIMILGKHGSGKSCLAARLGAGLARLANAETLVIFGPPPDDLTELASPSATTPTVYLVDDILDDWDVLLKLPSEFLGRRVLLIGTSALHRQSPEVERLATDLGAAIRFHDLRSQPSEAEFSELVTAVYGDDAISPSNRQRAFAPNVNFRAAVRRLEEREITDSFADLADLLDSDPLARSVLLPVIFCTQIVIGLPQQLLERHLRRSLPMRLAPWIHIRQGRGSTCLNFEDQDAAETIVRRYAGSDPEIRRILAADSLGGLVHASRIEDGIERSFLRRLFTRLSRHDAVLGRELATAAKRKLDRAIREQETTWAVAFHWLPVAERLDLPELLEACLSRLPKRLECLADSILWMHALGHEALAAELRRQLNNLGEVEPWIVERLGQMVRRLDQAPQRELGRSLCHLLLSGRSQRLVPVLTHQNAFGLISAIIAEHGSAFHRRKANQVIRSFLLFRLEAGESVPANWIESFLALSDRLHKQARHWLSIELSRVILTGSSTSLPQIEVDYNRVRSQERKWRLERLPALLSRLVDDAGSSGLFQAVHEGQLPPKIFQFIERWGRSDVWNSARESYLSGIEALQSENIPFSRVSALVIPFLISAWRRDARSVGRRVLRLALRWLPAACSKSTPESSRLLLQILHSTCRESSFPPEFGVSARHALGRLLTDDDESRALLSGTLAMVAAELDLSEIEFNSESGLLADWQDKSSLVVEYLARIRFVGWAAQEKGEFGERLFRRWCDVDFAQFRLAWTLFFLGEFSLAVETVDKIETKHEGDRTGLVGLRALIDLKQGAPELALEKWREVMRRQRIDRVGFSPAVARRLHLGCSTCCGPELRVLHRVCAELASRGPLREWSEVVGE